MKLIVPFSLIATLLGVAGGYAVSPRPTSPASQCSVSELQLTPSLAAMQAVAVHPTWRENSALMDSSWARWPSLTDF